MKVTIESKPDMSGYSLTLELSGETHVQEWEMTEYGARVANGFEWENAPISDEVYEAMESINCAAYGLVKELRDV